MNPDLFSKDTLTFIKLLNKYEVKYAIVGGIAVIYHGYSRGTGDVDFFYRITRRNSERLYEALEEFWEGDVPAVNGPDDLRKKGQVIQFGRPPYRIDLVNSIDGVTFAEVLDDSVEEKIDTEPAIPVHLISREKLILNKQSSDRPKDQQDVQNLNE